jgi:hypothetical protein
MLLNSEEQAMVRGDQGPGIKRCMDILVKFGEAVGAENMVPIASAHTMPKEPPELLREMTEGVNELGAPTTLHPLMSAFSPKSWKRMGISEEYANHELDQHGQRSEVYIRCGFLQTYCCIPMLVGNLPLKGEPVSWIGSGAQLMANSLLGARCNRDGTVVNLASAITGRAPNYGMFLDENRYGQVLVRFDGVDPGKLTLSQLGAVGYHVGAIAGGRNVVFDGIPKGMGLDRLKLLMAPLSVSGSVSMCHVVGTTPEAPALEAALGGGKPELTLEVGAEDINRALGMYSEGGLEVDMAVFGCPHCTIPEVKELVGLLSGKKLAQDKRLWIGLPHQMYRLAELMGYVQTVEKSGGVFASSCMATIPEAPLPEGVRVVVTNSFKAAHYITRLTKGNVKVLIGDMDQCIEAVTGGAWAGGVAA